MSHLQAEHRETVTLSKNQVIGLAHYGTATGPVIFYFHGLPSSRLEGAIWAKSALNLGFHIIAIDRPGIGLSSPQSLRTLLDWPPIVSEVASLLKIAQYHILGTSAGGPYALACAHSLPSSKLLSVGIVAGMGPVSLGLDGMALTSRLSVYFTQWMPSIGRKLYDWFVIPAAQNPNKAIFRKQVLAGFESLGEKDRVLLDSAENSELFVVCARECFAQGNGGLEDEWRVFVEDWEFELGAIEGSRVRFWCGDQDSVCPVEASRKMVRIIDGATLVEFEGETHYSVLLKKSEQILEQLMHWEVMY